jgi:hypothetical protein
LAGWRIGTVIYRPKSLLGAQAALFFLASLVHRGVLVQGFEHTQAAIAETVIAVVLATGLVTCMIRPDATRKIAIGVQGFALLGTLVGATMIAIGIGPRTPLDLGLHAVMLAMLIYGLVALLSG